MKVVTAFGRFWYDFIVGDDWKIAVAVVAALAVLCAVMLATGAGDATLAVLGGALVMAFFSLSLGIDTRRRG